MEESTNNHTTPSTRGNMLLPAGMPSTEVPVTIDQLIVRYAQEADGNSSDDLQFLELSIEDTGGGTYYVLKTERWAFDNLNELIKVITDFERRMPSCC